MTTRILELRSALGSGGGPEKTILLGAAQADPSRYSVTVTYIRDLRDKMFDLDQRAEELGVDFVPVTERNSFDPRALTQLYRLIREREIDIVHAHDYKTDSFALPLCGLAGAIPMSTAHGWAKFGRKDRLYNRWDKWVLGRYPLVIAVSAKIKSQLVEVGADPDRVRVIRNGVDTEVFRLDREAGRRLREAEGLPPDAQVIGAVGRLSDEKRFELLLEVAARLGLYAVLVGEGDERATLERRAAELGIGDRVKMLGHRSDTRNCHQMFDLYLQTSDTEGVPNALLEAMAVETPVVATDVGGTAEIIENGVHGLLVSKGDVDQMASAVRRTIEDRKATLRRVAKARDRVESELSFRHRMERLEGIYDELIRRFPREPRRRPRRT
ncbi:MAG: glycosyltransferase [Thermoanaerobaculia bacterium]